MAEEFSTKEFIIGTVAGAVMGTSLAILFAPKTGRELRGTINRSALRMKYHTEEWRNIAQEKGSGLKEKAYTTVEEIRKMAIVSKGRKKQAESDNGI